MIDHPEKTRPAAGGEAQEGAAAAAPPAGPETIDARAAAPALPKAWRDASLWVSLAAVVLLAGGPIVTGSASERENLFLILMAVALCSSLNLVLGYTGYVNFAHIAFFGLGGYIGFYLLAQQGWSLYTALLGAGLAIAVLAGALGSVILRLRGSYFALATIGINEAVRALVANVDLFGGATGLSLDFRRYADYGGPGHALWVAYYLLAGVALLGVLLSYAVKNSKFGLGLMAIREDEDAALVLGIAAPAMKTIVFVLSAVLPAMVGTLFFFKNGNVEPGDAFRLNMSIEGIVMVMLGGNGTVLGPVLGAAAYESLRSFLLTSPIFKDLQLAFAGLLLLLIVLFVPSGLLGWLRRHLRGVLG